MVAKFQEVVCNRYNRLSSVLIWDYYFRIVKSNILVHYVASLSCQHFKRIVNWGLLGVVGAH